MPVLLVNVRSHDSTAVEFHAPCASSFLQTENANHRTDHSVVGAVVVRVWWRAPTLIRVVRMHHGCEDALEPLQEVD
jgi:hypothetical protein